MSSFFLLKQQIFEEEITVLSSLQEITRWLEIVQMRTKSVRQWTLNVRSPRKSPKEKWHIICTSGIKREGVLHA